MDRQLDNIYDVFDNLLMDHHFDHVNTLLDMISIDCDVDLLLGILTVTLRWKDKLPARKDFYLCVETIVGPELLQGLE